MNEIFLRFICDTHFKGVAELLKMLVSIINGFMSLPLKPEYISNDSSYSYTYSKRISLISCSASLQCCMLSEDRYNTNITSDYMIAAILAKNMQSESGDVFRRN